MQQQQQASSTAPVSSPQTNPSPPMASPTPTQQPGSQPTEAPPKPQGNSVTPNGPAEATEKKTEGEGNRENSDEICLWDIST